MLCIPFRLVRALAYAQGTACRHRSGTTTIAHILYGLLRVMRETGRGSLYRLGMSRELVTRYEAVALRNVSCVLHEDHAALCIALESSWPNSMKMHRPERIDPPLDEQAREWLMQVFSLSKAVSGDARRTVVSDEVAMLSLLTCDTKLARTICANLNQIQKSIVNDLREQADRCSRWQLEHALQIDELLYSLDFIGERYVPFPGCFDGDALRIIDMAISQAAVKGEPLTERELAAAYNSWRLVDSSVGCRDGAHLGDVTPATGQATRMSAMTAPCMGALSYAIEAFSHIGQPMVTSKAIALGLYLLTDVEPSEIRLTSGRDAILGECAARTGHNDLASFAPAPDPLFVVPNDLLRILISGETQPINDVKDLLPWWLRLLIWPLQSHNP